MADFSQKNRKKCKKIFHIIIIYWDTNGCKNGKIPFFFPPRAEFRIGILTIFANHSAGTEWICTVETRRATSLHKTGIIPLTFKN